MCRNVLWTLKRLVFLVVYSLFKIIFRHFLFVICIPVSEIKQTNQKKNGESYANTFSYIFLVLSGKARLCGVDFNTPAAII